ncbi:hypothetical protein JCM11641_002334 [Rhodosporidiobolus odoratus]
MTDRIILYDLVPDHQGPYFSPNTWKARLALLHYNLDFDVQDLTYSQLKQYAKRQGRDRAIIPFIELPDGQLITDSWHIAEWLEKTYPDRPSLFLPDAPTPVSPSAPGLQLAKNYAVLINKGLGDSDSQWAPFFELSAQGIADLMHDSAEREYFTSDYKLGAKDAWKTITSLNKAALTAHAKAALFPLNEVLATSPYMAGQHPGFVDYVVYGRYHMMRAACPALSHEIWRAKETGNVAAWIDRLEGKWAEQLKPALERLLPL